MKSNTEVGIIYKSTNIINKKSYIGQTISTLNRRKTQHKRIAMTGSDYLFHRALRKYGFENFSWEILETCEKSILNEREEYYIKEFKTYAPENQSGYNMTRGGDTKYGSEGEFHYLNQMTSDEKEEWLVKYRIGKNNPNFGNGKNLCGEKHFTKRMSIDEYQSWANSIKGSNNYQSKLSKNELKNKNFLNKMNDVDKKEWIKNNLCGDKNPFLKAVKLNPEKYCGKNHPCFGKSYPDRRVKYVVTYPDGKEEVITKLIDFCKNNGIVTPYGLRKVLNKKVDMYKGYKLRYYNNQ
jgi:group I intron endonuclease